MEVAPILEDLKKMFQADERLTEPNTRPTRTDMSYFHDQKIMAENRLRQLVGAPVVAHKRHY